MATTTSDDAFHEIQLNGKQLVFLFMAVTVVSVVIFLCGVLVGRGVRTDAPAEQLIAQDAAAPAPEAPAPPVTTGTSGTAPVSETLSYPDRLASGTPAREQLRDTDRPAPPPEVGPVALPTPPPAAPAPAEPTPTPAAATAKRPATTEPAGSGFAIQLAALRQRDEADGIARRLSGKGYPAYVMAPAAGAPPVFRVRVGKFKERTEAESVAARLQKEEQFDPWIVR